MEHANSPSGCVHALPGRLRVKLAAVKKSPAVAQQVKRALQEEWGVVEAAANPVTGSVLVRYDGQMTTPQAILARLAPFGLSSTAAPVPNALSDFSHQFTKAVGKELVKLALVQMLPGGPIEVLCALI